MARQADGKLVALGSSAGGATLARYNPDGSLDTTFSGDGRRTDSFGTASDLVLQTDGKIVAVGGSSGDFAVARYNPDGSFDTTFSGDGKQTTDFASAFGDSAASVALQADGKIVVAGDSSPDFAVARYNPDGSLDTAFSGDGKQTTDFGGIDRAAGVALQPDGKIVAVGGTFLGGPSNDFAVARYNSDGSLDTTFSGDGKQTTDFVAGGFDAASDVMVQPDGKIVAVGDASGDGFVLARYNSDGSLDMTFSGDGKQTTEFGGFGFASDVALQADAKIVVVGAGPNDFAGARYNSDGSLDTTFSGDGKQTTDFGSFDDRASGVVLQADAKIVAVGVGGGVGDFALARYNVDGSLDTTFSGDGKQTTEFPGNDQAAAVAVQADGKVVAVGSGGGIDFALARYNPDGSPDATFSGDGKQTTDFTGKPDRAKGVAVQTDGKIVVVGRSEIAVGGGNVDFALARYNPDGSLDMTFSGDGKQTTDISGAPFSIDEGHGVVLQTDGKIVVIGSERAFGGGAIDFALARYNADGSLDTSFSGDGKQTTDFPSGTVDGASGIGLQADGRLVAVGSGNSGDFALARYNPDGSLDTSFDGDGKQTSDVSGGIDRARAVVVQTDGKIVAVGSGALDVAVARYNSDGSLDTTFSGDGRQTTDFSGGTDEANGLVLQPNGKLVAAGEAGGDFALARYDPDGSLDTSFSGDGKHTVDFAGGADRALGVARQPDGRIVAAGGATGETEDFAVARFEVAALVSDTTPPQTSITAGPGEGATTDDSTPTFGFSSSEAGSSFSCRVDGGSAFACSSPVTVGPLSDGQHSFSVAATDAAGNTDASPASRTFTVQTQSQQPPGEQPPGEQPPVVPPAASPFTAPLTNPVSTLSSPSEARFGAVAGATATVSGSGSVLLSRPLVFCPAGPPACRVTVEASAQVPTSGARSAATRRARIGRAVFSVRAGQAARVRFTLSRSGLAALRRQRRLRTTVRVVATHGTRRTVRTVTVILRAPVRPR